MEITDELLAAYAEGKVSKEERSEVRNYLIENQNELEDILMMKDNDYELEVDSKKKEKNRNISFRGKRDSLPNISYSAAAFVPFSKASISPHVLKNKGNIEMDSKRKQNGFTQRLDELLDEIIK